MVPAASHGRWPPNTSYDDAELGAPAANSSRNGYRLRGPAYSISTACTSSARALISAQRLLEAGACAMR